MQERIETLEEELEDDLSHTDEFDRSGDIDHEELKPENISMFLLFR